MVWLASDLGFLYLEGAWYKIFYIILFWILSHVHIGILVVWCTLFVQTLSWWFHNIFYTLHPLTNYYWGTIFVPSFRGTKTNNQTNRIAVDILHQSIIMTCSFGLFFSSASSVAFTDLMPSFVFVTRHQCGASIKITVLVKITQGSI